MDTIKAFTSEQLKTEVPQFNIGDTVKVHVRIVEGARVRTQIFEGTVIAKRNGGSMPGLTEYVVLRNQIWTEP